MMPRPEAGEWDVTAIFMNGQVAMMIADEWMVDYIGSMRDDFGYVLPPRGPRLNTYRVPDDCAPLIVPITYQGNDLDVVMTAVNLWFMPVVDDWRAGVWGAYRDRRAIEETMTMLRSGRYTAFRNSILIPGMEIGEIAWHIWWWGDDPSSLIESVSPSWNALIEDANAHLFN
jgi:hypothetical protein